MKKVFLLILLVLHGFSFICSMDRRERGSVFRDAARAALESDGAAAAAPVATAVPRESVADRALRELEALEMPSAAAATPVVDGAAAAVEEGEELCAICQTPLSEQPTKKLPGCSHSLHKKCLEDMVNRGVPRLCPVCRTPFDPPGTDPVLSRGKRLFDAVEAGNLAEVRRVVGEVSDENRERFNLLSLRTRDSNETAIFKAVESGHIDIVDFLLNSLLSPLDRQSIIEISNIIRNTVLMAAVRTGNIDMVNLVLDNIPAGLASSQFVRTVDGSGFTALHIASLQGVPAIVTRILRAIPEADVRARREFLMTQNGRGNTALHLSAEHGYEAIIRLLVDYVPNSVFQGQLVMLLNGAGRSAVALVALSYGDRAGEMVRYLCDKIPNGDEKITFLRRVIGIVSIERSYAASLKVLRDLLYRAVHPERGLLRRKWDLRRR
jgi:hypothetical protein